MAAEGFISQLGDLLPVACLAGQISLFKKVTPGGVRFGAEDKSGGMGKASWIRNDLIHV